MPHKALNLKCCSSRSARAHTPKRGPDNGEDDAQEGVFVPARKRPRTSDIPLEDRSDQASEQEPRGNDAELCTLQSVTANSSKRPKITERTARYIFSSSPIREVESLDEDVRKHKDRLHEKFVNKLGRPDSIAVIKSRYRVHHNETEEAPADDEEDYEEDEDEMPATSKKRGTTVARGASRLTPMERQVIDLKADHPDALLVIEVGYKFRFFGEDARTAAKELGLMCIPGKFRFDEHPSEAHLNKFASASFPVSRLPVHLKRLVTAGHKVGVVRQLETAALKAVGSNKSGPFVRKLTNLYTKGTFIDDIEGIEGSTPAPSGGAPATGFLLCLTESKTKGTDENVHVGIVAVQPQTGDVIYDDFHDGFMRSELETRLLHIAPCEFLVVGELSAATEKLVKHLSGSKWNIFGDKIRMERVSHTKTMTTEASSHVSNFYASQMKSLNQEQDEKATFTLEKILQLPGNVTVCLSAMINHMEEYGLEHVFDLTKYFQSFSARSHMLLNGTTLTSLEIYQNQTDQQEKGSLFWSLNRTSTPFGKRLLRKWVGRPLLDRSRLEERIDAVEEMKEAMGSVKLEQIRRLLLSVKSDLEKSLIRIYYGRCTRSELLIVLQTMQRISTEFAHGTAASESGFLSSMIKEGIAALPVIQKDVISYLEKINMQAARTNDKYDFFQESEETEQIRDHKIAIIGIEHELDEQLLVAGEKIGQKVAYVVSAGTEYLIEVENTKLKRVPASWAKMSGTKKLSRFHTPEVIRLISERNQQKEALAAACDGAFAKFLSDISSKYHSFRDCIQALATLDCLLSLATVAGQPGYVKPEYSDEICIKVEGGRHPMVEQLLLESYVPNNINFAHDSTRALLITGPNMGGKSSYVRQVALIAIMAQIGSYVPADHARLGLLDAVFTRMGAFDNLMAGESTFMVELSETADILKQASPRSLVILDELGRGTSTHDGVAIAEAVLDHVVRDIKCLTLFITHHQSLSSLSNAFEHGELRNVHMKFTQDGEDEQKITFLYEVGDGVAHRSYGSVLSVLHQAAADNGRLNVARLASIPDSVLKTAAAKSRELEDDLRKKQLRQM